MKITELTDKITYEIINALLFRDENRYEKEEVVVAEILAEVRAKGDEALFSYTYKFDKAKINAGNILVTRDEIDEAYRKVDPSLIEVMKNSAQNIRLFHEKQLRTGYLEAFGDGILLGQKVTPMERAGIYVPGGKAAYPSTVLMCAVTARVAGVDEVVMVTPPDAFGGINNPATLVAADIAAVDRIYKVGGAQAIAALAYGTDLIPRADIIAGPGNIYVALAKKAVYGTVSIDSVAGPSEILVIADQTANPKFVAADLLSQAEHDEMAAAILLTDSAALARAVNKEIDFMLKDQPRKAIIEKSLSANGNILVAKSIDECVRISNMIAPEHLELMIESPFERLSQVKNAGAVFLGAYSPEPLGDYFAGANHVLPTNGTARFFSPLSVENFLKKSSVISYSKDALKRAHADIEYFAEAEGLAAHKRAIEVRFSEDPLRTSERD